jgi:radical SAM superfamily enzyme YgiQ (UPF0313 family)
VLGLCREIRARGLEVRWGGTSRVDSAALRPEVLDAARSAGCDRLEFGVESGSPEVLRRIAKGITPERALEAHRAAHARSRRRPS